MNRSYVRGPYRTKIRSFENSIDCEPLYEFLLEKRKELHEKFKPSFNRSKITENIQSLLDYLKKQVKKEKEKERTLEQEVEALKRKVASLEAIINLNELPTNEFVEDHNNYLNVQNSARDPDLLVSEQDLKDD